MGSNGDAVIDDRVGSWSAPDDVNGNDRSFSRADGLGQTLTVPRHSCDLVISSRGLFMSRFISVLSSQEGNSDHMV